MNLLRVMLSEKNSNPKRSHTGSPSHHNQTRKRKKRNPNWRGKLTLPLFVDNIILYTKNPQDTTKIYLSSSMSFCILILYPANLMAQSILKEISPGISLEEMMLKLKLQFTQTHVHGVSDAIQPSHPLSSPSPAPNPSQHQSLFQ